MKKFINFGKHKSVQSLLGDFFWTLFSQAFIVVVNILSVYILANLLSQHNYGEFKLITTWLAIALGVGYTGYSYLLPQKIAKGEKYELGEIFKETFIKSLPTLLGLLAIAFYYLFKANLNLGVGFLFASVLAPVLCISTLVNTYYMGRRNFKMFALAQNFVDSKKGSGYRINPKIHIERE
jgi:O-antigen/teichoic acid export membrane protein